MTAEVVVMNREGVALAADSTVSIGDAKTFDTANKLFMIAPGIPVGIMIYNAATFMNLPWEVLIHAYREYLLDNRILHDSLEGYAENFFEFLIERKDIFATIDQQKLIVGAVVGSLFNEITTSIWKNLENVAFKSENSITESQVLEIIDIEISNLHTPFQGHEQLYSDSDTKQFIKRFHKNFHDLINELRDDIFEKIPFNADQDEKLRDIYLSPFIRNLQTPWHSGIVFAGYGECDLLPRCTSYIVDYLICDQLKYRLHEEKQSSIEFTGASASIVPFAQEDVIQTFLLGRHPMFIEIIGNELSSVLEEKQIHHIIQNIEKTRESGYTTSIVETVASLPKEDLAGMAERLVSITSFMRKVSITPETVGGPVDVAVISKKDGFVWISRKQYFDKTDNLHIIQYMKRKGD